MSELLIEKLYKQSLFETEGDGFPDIEMDVKKFAELIIQECSNKIEDQKATAPPQVAAGLNFAQVIIKEHFYGVE